MAKNKTVFVCNQCGYENPRWSGKCPECGSWNSFEELQVSPGSKNAATPQSSAVPLLLPDVKSERGDRLTTSIRELDRVLGGGIFPASVVLIAGDPGIGKSTLLLQMAAHLVQKGAKVLYVSGEESLSQIGSRAERLNLSATPLPLLAETDLDNIIYQIEQTQPDVIIVDSIQSVYSEQANGAPGNVSQIRESAARLFRLAKEQNRAVFLVGHITKEGGIAGPKILEHTVDVVIYFEGDNLYRYRILRSLKNRFGATNEIGLFMMDKSGLLEVDNPSQLFLSDVEHAEAGSGVVCSFEGTRPILVEVQALVTRSNYGVPQRTVGGFDQRRLSLLLAILEKHCGLNFGYSDVFVKIVGGIRLDDPGIDLGLALAIYSSLIEQPLKPYSIFIGELGLSGEIRPVAQMKRRIQEAAKLGFKSIYVPPLGDEEKSIDLPAGVRLLHKKHISDIIHPAERRREQKEEIRS